MNTTITPHDWPEDWENGDDNGSYIHICTICKVQFQGDKHRLNVCKKCYDENDAEAKRRAEWLNAHNAPKGWVVLTIDEVRNSQAQMLRLVVDLAEERALRRKLAAALVMRDSTIWRDCDTAARLLEESTLLDEMLTEREKREKMTQT